MSVAKNVAGAAGSGGRLAQPDDAGPVLFLDSGVGGLPYLERAREQLPCCPMHYLADRAGFPYGTKSAEQVRAIALDRVRRLRARFAPRAIVIACNTASQAALLALRDHNPQIDIIGTVPAVKPAAETTKTGIIAVLATAHAVEDPYLDDLIARYAPNVEVLRRAAQDLVEFVEHRFLDATAEERRAIIEPHLRALADRGADRIVLACTHFLHLAADITACAHELYGPRIELVDSRNGVAARLAAIVHKDASATTIEHTVDCDAPQGILLLSGEEAFNPQYARWARAYGLSGPVRL